MYIYISFLTWKTCNSTDYVKLNRLWIIKSVNPVNACNRNQSLPHILEYACIACMYVHMYACMFVCMRIHVSVAGLPALVDSLACFGYRCKMLLPRPHSATDDDVWYFAFLYKHKQKYTATHTLAQTDVEAIAACLLCCCCCCYSMPWSRQQQQVSEIECKVNERQKATAQLNSAQCSAGFGFDSALHAVLVTRIRMYVCICHQQQALTKKNEESVVCMCICARFVVAGIGEMLCIFGLGLDHIAVRL